MTVVTITNCPPALRGHITGWLQEIDTGVYVGHISKRVRDELWDRICKYVKTGNATMVFSTKNEQKLDFRVHNSAWLPTDFDGLTFMLRPSVSTSGKQNEVEKGFSKAAKILRARNIAKHQMIKSALNDQYVVVDIETSGLNPNTDFIIEIGALHIVNGEIACKFSALIKNNQKIPLSIQQLTGITDQMIEAEGTDLKKTLEKFLDFINDFTIVAHNVSFEYSFLRAAYNKCNIPMFNNKNIDTYELSRRLINNVENYKLITLAEHLDIRINKAHRSLDDCWTTKQLYDKLIKIKGSK